MAEGQGDGALDVGLLEGRYGEAERRREGVAELSDDPVDEGTEGRELGAGARREARRALPDGDVDVGEAGVGEDGALEVVGSGLGLLEDDSLGRHTDGQKEWTERGLVSSSVGRAGAHDGGERLLTFLEVCLSGPEDACPGGDWWDVRGWSGARASGPPSRFPRAWAKQDPSCRHLVDKWIPADGA